MHQNLETIGHDSLLTGMADAMRATSVTVMDAETVKTEEERDFGSISPDFPRSGMNLHIERAALVVIDPQLDFLNPKDAASAGLGQGGIERKTVQNLARLFRASKLAGIPVAISLTSQRRLHSNFMPELEHYIEDGRTIICSPHTAYSHLSRINDIGLRLRKQRVGQIVLAGIIASHRIESHLRDFIEQGFEVAVVRDAVAGSKLPEGDGYLSALVNFRCIANALWTTEETVKRLG
jgi:nicotinamidase-related amidase